MRTMNTVTDTGTRCVFCRNGEDSNLVTTAFDLGLRWPDGRVYYTLTCDSCAMNVFCEQVINIRRTVTCSHVEDVEIVSACRTFWRSHGCNWAVDVEHEHEHVCECGDRPTENDEFYT